MALTRSIVLAFVLTMLVAGCRDGSEKYPRTDFLEAALPDGASLRLVEGVTACVEGLCARSGAIVDPGHSQKAAMDRLVSRLREEYWRPLDTQGELRAFCKDGVAVVFMTADAQRQLAPKFAAKALREGDALSVTVEDC